MKIIKFVRNSAGIGLVEVMMAVAVTGGLTLTIAKLMENASQSAKQVEAKSENTNLKGLVQDVLNNTTACKNTFGPVMTAANISALSASPTATVALPNIKDKLNVIRYSTASTNISPLTITSMELTKYNALAYTGDLIINSTFKKSTNNIVMVKPIRIPINFSFSAGSLTACSTMAVGGEWLLGGNAGTVDGADYVGTSDNAPLNFKVNAQESGRIDTVGQTFFGYLAGGNFSPYTTSGTGFGYEALKGASYWNGGAGNSAFGTGTLKSIVNGGYNTAIGWNALVNIYTSSYNTAVGGSVLAYQTSGTSNTGVGYNSMKYMSSGSANTSLGQGAGHGLTSGSNNLFLGNDAGQSCGAVNSKLYIETTGVTVPLIGGDFSSSGRYVEINGRTTITSTSTLAGTSGLTVNKSLSNTTSETNAIYANHDATGVTGTAVGLRAQARNPVYASTGRLYGVKASAGGGAAGMNYGVWTYTEGGGAGLFASEFNTPPNASYTYDGWGMAWAAIFDGKVLMTTDLYLKNNLNVAGNSVFAKAVWMSQGLTVQSATNINGQLGVTGNLSVSGTASKTGPSGWTVTSDRRLKKNIKSLDGALAKITQLRPVNYDWRNPQGTQKIVHDSGFIAQEVEKIFPEWVGEQDVTGSDLLIIPKNKKAKNITLPYGFDAYIVKAIQELNEEVIKNKAMLKMMQEGLEQKVDANTKSIALLEEQVNLLQNENTLLKERLDKIEKKILEMK